MTTTPNGWPIIRPVPSGGIPPAARKVIIPGTGRHLILAKGPAATILGHVALWFHERVEPLDLGEWDEWGWSFRTQRGSTAWSEHAAAVAADLNATRHPMGVDTHRTFTTEQVTRINHRLERRYRGLIEWGGNWDRPDAMHLQLSPPIRDRHKSLALVLLDTPGGVRLLAANPGLRPEL